MEKLTKLYRFEHEGKTLIAWGSGSKKKVELIKSAIGENKCYALLSDNWNHDNTGCSKYRLYDLEESDFHKVNEYIESQLPKPKKTTLEDLYKDGDVCYLIFQDSGVQLITYFNHKCIGSNTRIVNLDERVGSIPLKWSNSPLTSYEDANPFIF